MGSHIPALRNRPKVVDRWRGFVLRLATLSRRDKLVAVALVDALHLRLWRCAICQQTLADRLGCSVRTVARALSALKAAGLVRWRRRRRKASEFAINCRCVDDSCSVPDGVDRPYRPCGGPLIRAESARSAARVGATDAREARASVERLAALAALPMPKASAALLATLQRRS